MSDINEIVIQEFIGIKLHIPDNALGPNSKVEEKNLGWPPPDKKEPTENASIPDHSDKKIAAQNKLKEEKLNLDVPTNLADGNDAGERLRNAIQSKQKQDK